MILFFLRAGLTAWATLSSIFPHDSQRMFKWNKRPLWSAPSLHKKHQTDESWRDGIWCDWTQMKYNLKLMSDLKFLRCQIFLGEEDNNYLNMFVFLFHELIKPFWFSSFSKHHRHKQTRSESEKADIPEGIYLLKHFFSHGMFDKWTAKEKFFT